MVCHPNRTFPLKELEWESQNRLPFSPHYQTISSLTSDPWPTAPVLAGYKWVVPEPYVCLTSIWHVLLLILTLCGVDESLGLHSLHLISFLGWALSSSIHLQSPFTSGLWVN